MTTPTTPMKIEKKNVSPADNKKRIENHKTTATHLEAAAKSHLDAAKHHEEEEHEKAAHSTIKAHGHLALAKDIQHEDLKNHALQNKA
jgi:hypothetical protein